MRSPENAPRVRDYAQLLQRYWVVIMLATMLSAGAGWLAWHDARNYVASVKFMLVTPGGAQPFDAFYGNLTATSRIPTYQDLIRSPEVIRVTEDELRLGQTDSALAQRIAIIPTRSAVFDVAVAADDPDVARNTVNTLAGNVLRLSDQFQKLDSEAAGLVLIDSASGAADARGTVTSALLKGGLLGLAASTVLMLGYGLARGSVSDRRQVAQIVGDATSRKSG